MTELMGTENIVSMDVDRHIGVMTSDESGLRKDFSLPLEEEVAWSPRIWEHFVGDVNEGRGGRGGGS